MPVLIGWMVGSALGPVAFSRAVVLMAVWVAVPIVAGRVVAAEVSLAAGNVAAIAAPLLLLAYALHRPSGSPTKLALLGGLSAFGRFALLLVIGREAFLLLWSEFVLARELPWLLLGVASLAAGAALEAWIERDARRTED